MAPQEMYSRQGSRVSAVTRESGLGELLQHDQQIVPYEPNGIAVAIGRGDSSIQALKWALDFLMVSENATLHLLHVQSPLRFVKSPLGSLPIEQVNEECSKQAKQQQILATERLLQKYRKMCERRKLKFEVHCVENASIQRAVTEQVSKLGISKLVLGSSSSRLKKFLKRQSTSAIVAQYVPDFCAVLVVRKGKLSSVKDSKLSTSYSTLTSGSMRDSKVSTSGLFSTNDSMPSWTPSSRTDVSFPQWSPSPSTEFSSVSDIYHREGTHDDVKFADMLFENGQGQLSSRNLIPGTTTDRNVRYGIAQRKPGSFGLPAMEKTMLEVQHSKSQSMDVKGSIRKASDEAPDKIASKPAKDMEIVPSSEQVNVKAHQRSPIRGSPPARTANQLYKTFSSPESMQKSESEETALSKLDAFKSQMLEDIRKKDDLCAFLQEALSVSEDRALQAKAKEAKRREEVLAALSNAKVEADVLKKEVDMARQQAAADRVRYIEVLAKVDDLKKDLVKEMQLRKHAEERGWEAKQEVVRLMRKSQREFMEYSYEVLQLATRDFCEERKLGEGGYGGVYMGILNDMTVAVKVLRQAVEDGQQQFQHEVEVLSHIRHPHIVVLLGACRERGCIVYEYLENGSLEDRLTCKNGTPPLPWYVRISICFEVATALIFLHNLSPNPIVHRDLKPGNVLLDCNFSSKLSDAGLSRWISEDETYNYTVYRETRPAGTFAYMDPEYLRTGSFGPHSDIFALGIVILQVLTGKQAVGVVDLVEAAVDANKIYEVLDQSAGEWPLSEAEDLAKLGLRCAEPRRRDRPNLETDVLATLMKLHEVAQKAELISSGSRALCGQDGLEVPRSFVCPLSQEVMRNPYTAADGFTYEFIAIKNWLDHHEVSPMTNLKLAHKQLSENRPLRSKIQNWNQEKMGAWLAMAAPK